MMAPCDLSPAKSKSRRRRDRLRRTAILQSNWKSRDLTSFLKSPMHYMSDHAWAGFDPFGCYEGSLNQDIILSVLSGGGELAPTEARPTRRVLPKIVW